MSIKPEILRSKFIGSLLGLAVGDALGMPVEGLTAEEIKVKFGVVKEMMDGRLPAGCYTDDTEMMIGVAESLIENKGFNGEDMVKKFIKNFKPWRGYGYGPTKVLELVKKGVSWEKAAEKLFGGEGSYGNGGAMRIAPVGLLYHDNVEVLRNVAYRVAKITHANKLGMEGGAIQAYGVALAVTEKPYKNLEVEAFATKLCTFSCENIFREKIMLVKQLLKKRVNNSEVVFKLGNGIETFNSVVTALYCFLANYKSFEDAVVYAVNLGGDADTIGAMTGAVAGAYHGVEAIPKRWLARLEGKTYIEGLAEKLWMVSITNRKNEE
ncbi:MAG: ADP-ribosylglycohydrolase family protein [Candidatus Bathyarchaeota archaeon]